MGLGREFSSGREGKSRDLTRVKIRGRQSVPKLVFLCLSYRSNSDPSQQSSFPFLFGLKDVVKSVRCGETRGPEVCGTALSYSPGAV